MTSLLLPLQGSSKILRPEVWRSRGLVNFVSSCRVLAGSLLELERHVEGKTPGG
jgi:hypothetical protein